MHRKTYNGIHHISDFSGCCGIQVQDERRRRRHQTREVVLQRPKCLGPETKAVARGLHMMCIVKGQDRTT